MARKTKRVETYTERKDGRLVKSFRVDGVKYYVYGDTIEEVDAKIRKKRKEIEKGIIQGNSKLTLAEYFDIWYQRKEKAKKAKPATLYTDKRRFNRVRDGLGKKAIKKISRTDILNLQVSLHDDLSTKGVNDTITLLKTVFKSAVFEKIVAENPCEGVKNLPKTREEEEKNRKSHRYLSDSEITTFFKYANNSNYRFLFALMLYTGMRCGEACALTWGDIDKENEVIHITKTITRISDKEFTVGSPKTKASERDIGLTDEAEELLKAQKALSLMLYGFKSVTSDARIFTTNKGGLVTQGSISPVIKNICRKATEKGESLEYFGSHAFRHTCASWMIAEGYPLNVIARQLGHENTIALQKFYSHPDPKKLKEAVQMVSKNMSKKIKWDTAELTAVG